MSSYVSTRGLPCSSSGGSTTSACRTLAIAMNSDGSANCFPAQFLPCHAYGTRVGVSSGRRSSTTHNANAPPPEAERERARIADIRVRLSVLQEPLGHESIRIGVLLRVARNRPKSQTERARQASHTLIPFSNGTYFRTSGGARPLTRRSRGGRSPWGSGTRCTRRPRATGAGTRAGRRPSSGGPR